MVEESGFDSYDSTRSAVNMVWYKNIVQAIHSKTTSKLENKICFRNGVAARNLSRKITL